MKKEILIIHKTTRGDLLKERVVSDDRGRFSVNTTNISSMVIINLTEINKELMILDYEKQWSKKELNKLFGFSQSSINLYTDTKLVFPLEKTFGRKTTKKYSVRNVFTIFLIRALLKKGFSLKTIKKNNLAIPDYGVRNSKPI